MTICGRGRDLKVQSNEMDLAESGINQRAVTKGHTEMAKSTLPSSFERP
jgi:hypothetical protein